MQKRTRTMMAAAMVASGAAAAWGGPATAVIMPGLAVLEMRALASGAARREPLLRNTGSFIVVHRGAATGGSDEEIRFSLPSVGGEQTGGSAADLIAVPSNARAGDPAFAEPEDAAWEETWVEEPTEERYGIAFAEGVRLGYTALRRPDQHRGDDRRGRRHEVGEPGAEFGADDLHRSAQLRFAEAAQPRLDGLDDGFRRAQLTFHRATLTPGVVRGSDGLRHERAPSSPRPSRGRDGSRGPRR
jgi:hypothetical protein